MAITNNIKLSLLALCFGLQIAQAATTGYQRFLNDKAIENLQSLEASHMVYNVYENFVVPRICQNNKELIGGKKKEACKLLGHVQESDFVKVKGDLTGVLYKAKDNYTQAAYYRFTGTKPEMAAAAPVGYRVSYVGCYRRAKNRNLNGTECSLFFMVLEGVNNKKPPIIAIKGSSHNEDWKNNLLAGAPILNEITTIFTTLFKELRSSIIGGDGENVPGEMQGLSAQFAGFFKKLSASTLRLTFTGHSLGGALAQELAREVFIATRDNIRDRSSGPTIEVITWNGLSYTSMIGRLKKGLKNVSDPLVKAGWKESDALKLENFKSVFDGRFLSAVNFHTADDILTQLINTSIIGKILRADQHDGIIQAGADVLLASERYIAVSGLSGKVNGHGTVTLLQDALYSMGARKKKGRFAAVDLETQLAELEKRESGEREAARYKDTPQYFMQNGLNSDRYEKDGGMNFDLLIVAKEIEHNEKRAEKYEAMEKAILRNGRYFGRLLTPENGVVDFTSQLTPSLY